MHNLMHTTVPHRHIAGLARLCSAIKLQSTRLPVDFVIDLQGLVRALHRPCDVMQARIASRTLDRKRGTRSGKSRKNPLLILRQCHRETSPVGRRSRTDRPQSPSCCSCACYQYTQLRRDTNLAVCVAETWGLYHVTEFRHQPPSIPGGTRVWGLGKDSLMVISPHAVRTLQDELVIRWGQYQPGR